MFIFANGNNGNSTIEYRTFANRAEGVSHHSYPEDVQCFCTTDKYASSTNYNQYMVANYLAICLVRRAFHIACLSNDNVSFEYKPLLREIIVGMFHTVS